MVRSDNRLYTITLSRGSFVVRYCTTIVLSTFTRTTRVARHLSGYHEHMIQADSPAATKRTSRECSARGVCSQFAVCETIAGKIRNRIIKKKSCTSTAVCAEYHASAFYLTDSVLFRVFSLFVSPFLLFLFFLLSICIFYWINRQSR